MLRVCWALVLRATRCLMLEFGMGFAACAQTNRMQEAKPCRKPTARDEVYPIDAEPDSQRCSCVQLDLTGEGAVEGVRRRFRVCSTRLSFLAGHCSEKV